MTTFLSQRQALRREIRSRRNALSQNEQQLAAQRVYQRLTKHPKVQDAQRVSLFLSFDGEINTKPLIEAFWQQGKEVYLPVIHPFSKGHLLFLRYARDSVMIHHPFGIQELSSTFGTCCPQVDWTSLSRRWWPLTHREIG